MQKARRITVCLCTALLIRYLLSGGAWAADWNTVDNRILDGESQYALHQSEAMPGETLHFRSVLLLRGGDTEYILLGQLSPELDFLGLERITVGEATLNASYYTLLHRSNADGYAFEIHISALGIPSAGETELACEYSARLDTVPDGGMPVRAGIGLLTGGGEYAEGEAAQVTSHSLELFRGCSAEGRLRALSGAGFSLYRDAEQEERLRFVRSEDGRYILCASDECSHTHHEYVLRTADTGTIRLDGLISGVYYLQETRPPRGYESAAENEALTVTRSGKVYLGGECAEDGLLRLITVSGENSAHPEKPTPLSLYQIGCPVLIVALLAAALDYRRLCRMIVSIGE